jgi:UDPglucose--hexose-1-phosphate uridylyltransferase
MHLQEFPHRRYNILTGEWVLVSPHRLKRPWQGKLEHTPPETKKSYESDCYLCPGNTRAGGKKNPPYKSTFAFTNDFSALLADGPAEYCNKEDLIIAESERGICRVICFSPRHDLTLSLMKARDIENVIDLWIKEYKELGGRTDIGYVQIFENRGSIMGCSNPHPHGQIWANETTPFIPSLESRRQKEYLDKKGSCLLCDYLALEQKEQKRIVFENDSFVVLVPFWAVWPFEVLLAPKEHCASIPEINNKQKRDLALAIKKLGIKYDNLFETSFPYSMGIHQKPTDNKKHKEWHFHFHYYPPLLRSATIKKFMVGYEMLATPQRDITAEKSAEMLRELPEIHFLERR